MSVFEKLKQTISSLEVDTIPVSRKKELQRLIDFITNKKIRKEPIRLNFICTHNSRRSHLSQVWAQTLAYHVGLTVQCFSGGTARTALFPVVAKTLKEAGFQIEVLAHTDNPIYSIKYAENEHPIIGFSKKMDDTFNPKSDFTAVMTCSQADADCPVVPGAEIRMALPFEDPKAFDHTPHQIEKYRERSLQIATELFYVFSNV